MFAKSFDEIGKEDLDALVRTEVPEGRSIEYKEALPGGSDRDKHEFLADLSSFANAAGGILIYGVKERGDDGRAVAEAIQGIEGLRPDEAILRLEQLHLSNIDRRIVGVQMKPVLGFSAGPVLLVRVPKSWAGPHMIKSSSRFYTRDSRGKHQMDVTEIRHAFLISDTLPEKAKNFRAERLARISAGESPVSLTQGPMVVLHVIPVSAFNPTKQIDIGLAPQIEELRPLDLYCLSQRFNLDGHLRLSYKENQSGRVNLAYVQLLRSGVLESVDVSPVRMLDDEFRISAAGLERKLLDALSRYFKAAIRLGLDLPAFLLVSLHGVKGFRIAFDESNLYVDEHPQFDRDDLLLPDVFIEDWNAEPAVVVKPIFDSIWQSSGWARCLHYDKEGKWTGKPNL